MLTCYFFLLTHTYSYMEICFLFHCTFIFTWPRGTDTWIWFDFHTNHSLSLFLYLFFCLNHILMPHTRLRLVEFTSSSPSSTIDCLVQQLKCVPREHFNVQTHDADQQLFFAPALMVVVTIQMKIAVKYVTVKSRWWRHDLHHDLNFSRGNFNNISHQWKQLIKIAKSITLDLHIRPII